MSQSILVFISVCALSGIAAPTATLGDEPAATPEQLDFFEKEVRPLLVEHCYECHSVKAKRVEAKLLLDSRKGHLLGGDSGPAIVPGSAAESSLIQAVRYESYEMPPKGKLPDKDIETLVRWVNMGSPWPEEAAPLTDSNRDVFDLEKRKADFWVWQPVAKVNSPAIKNTAWPKSEIDRHILAKLEQSGLNPTEDADSTALLRRLYFDLIGLPPTPEEVKAFRSDSIEKTVDQLLDSQHFGERWGRHWLDLVRYAESRGHEFDNDTPNAFQYRDYVIRALNADLPYDQFVREHIAGDLLAKPRLHPDQKFNESVLGTGFWFLGEWVHSPVDIRKDESDRFDNMIDVMSKTFLGVTVACARCHDHKFDAISTADYYSLSGYLQSSDYRQVPFESIEQNRRVAQQLASVDAKYQQQIIELLESQGLRLPTQTSYLSDEAIVVDYGRIPQSQYIQDGNIFGLSPRREGMPYLEMEMEPVAPRVPATNKRQKKNKAATASQTANEGKADATVVEKPASSDEKPKLDEESQEKNRLLTVKQNGPKLTVARYGAAVSDSIWTGLESISLGAVQDRSEVAKLPSSGRTLRSPTFGLKHGKLSCLVNGTGHIVACVDSHRLVAGPLHKETIRQIKSDERWVTLKLDRYIGHRLHLEFIPAENSQLSVRMVTQGLDAKGLADLDTRISAQDKQYEAYAQAAEGILNSGYSNLIEERIFADFESGTYEGWTVTGDAFGETPQTLETVAPYQGQINGRGSFFVNSHNIRSQDRDKGLDVGKGDALTGVLTSPEFLIDFDSIEFLVGGGKHEGKTCVNLIIDGKAALSATGKADNQMSLNTWDVRSFAGKTARIQVVDDHKYGWGNIGIDHITFQKSITPSFTGKLQASASEKATDAAARIIRAWLSEREQLSSQIVRRSRVAPAMLDGTGEDDHILIRGNSAKPGEVEPRHFLTAIAGSSPMPIKAGSGRLELAEQINDSANPLTSRVIVNRIWHHLMGRGIVPTVDDFGYLGQRPTHPELLDHLATRFVEDGRSIKRMIKYIVMSRVYQMSSHASPASLEVDPNNQLWHYQPPKRLQGEVIRDSLLALSGRLDRAAFGPPVPIHLTPFMDGRGRPEKSGPLDGEGRRSIYIAVRRNFLSPLMLTFDTPVPFSSMGRRNVSNVPAQALILLNDPLVVNLASEWGKLALQNVAGDSTQATTNRIEWMYLSAFGRRPTTNESETAVAFVQAQAKKQNVSTVSPELWTSLAHVLVNTKEFIFLR